jgi:adenylate cyclase
MKDRFRKFLSVSPLKISIGIVFIVIILYFINFPFLHFMELETLDLRFVSRGVRAPGGETVIAVIDEKSLTELGRWPWSRATIAKLVDVLKDSGAKAVGFDIVFAEPEEHPIIDEITDIEKDLKRTGKINPGIVNVLNKKKKEADTDAILAKSIKQAGNVTLGYFFYMSEKDIGHMKAEAMDEAAKYIADSKYQLVQYFGKPLADPVMEALAVAPNIKPLSEAAENSGFFNAFPDTDGTNRWSTLAINFRDNYYPSLSMAVLEQYLDWPTTSLLMTDYGLEGIKIGDTVIPTDEAGRVLINYLGPIQTFPYYSIADIVNGRIDKAALENKIVLVGATATGIYDLRVTPFSAVYPGIEIHATVIDNILHESFIKRPGWTGLIDILAIILLGLAAVPALSRVKALFGLGVSLALIVIYMVINRFIFSQFNLWLNLVYPLLSIVLVYAAITIYRYMTEERERKKIRGTFQYYLSGPVIEEMLKDPSKLQLGGEKKDLTVLFSDIRGFTTISEKLTPEELVHLLNEYLTVMTDQVFEHGGLLDKYMGDAIMAVFGAPIDDPNHPTLCCRTALAMMDELGKLQKKWTEEGRPVLDIGIGINTGDMVVGNMGSQMRFDYTVMGDNVNLGSRLEGINKEYGTNIVVSEYTHERIKDIFFCRELDAVRVKGKILPVRIFELVGGPEKAEEWKEFIALYDEGLRKYREGNWDDAIRNFEAALKLRPDDYPSRMYIERCSTLKEHPPEGEWDGVYTMTRK